MGLRPSSAYRLSYCEEAGRYSRWNLAGRMVTRRDQPKSTKAWEGEGPNCGSNGTLPITFSRDVCQRDLHPPKILAIRIELFVREDGDSPAL